MPQALALAAQMVATLALLVVLALSLFVLGLALRTYRPSESPAQRWTTRIKGRPDRARWCSADHRSREPRISRRLAEVMRAAAAAGCIWRRRPAFAAKPCSTTAVIPSSISAHTFNKAH
jgi:peptidoglycan/LPS O-acetylase OafA/YrhL